MPGRNARSGSISRLRRRNTGRGSRATRCPASGTHSAPSASLRCVFDLSSKIPVGFEANWRSKRIYGPLNFVSVRKKSALCFLQLTEILIEPLFRLERVPKRTNLEGRAQFARGDAGFRRRGRANSALSYNGDGTAERRRWQRGVN